MSPPYIITIAGGTASGKSTLTAHLLAALGDRATVLHTDSYYRDQGEVTLEQRLKTNYDHPDAIELSLLVSDLRLLKSGKRVLAPVYDFSQHTRDRAAREELLPKPVIIVDGILALANEEVRAMSDLKVFVDAPAAIRFNRRLERDVLERGRTPEGVKNQWEQTVEPMYQQLCAPTAAFADLIVDGTQPTAQAIEKILKICNIQPC